MTYDDLIDDLMLQYSQNEYESEVTEAKNQFHRTVGIFDEESIDVENKINLFMDWYLFHRPLIKNGETPIQLVCKQLEKQQAQNSAVNIKNLCASRYSLFEFLNFRAGKPLV